MSTFLQITELSIEQERGTLQWGCHFKVKNHSHRFVMFIKLLSIPRWIKSNVFYEEDEEWIEYKSDTDDWSDHLVYQCITAIKKHPNFRVKFLYLDAKIHYKTNFTPSDYEDVEAKLVIDK